MDNALQQRFPILHLSKATAHFVRSYLCDTAVRFVGSIRYIRFTLWKSAGATVRDKL
jgi:hypothetical protein